MNISPKVIMITGAAGYIGAMLADQFSKSPELEKIIAVDKLPIPPILKDNKKIIWITANLYQNIWRIPALINKPEIVIHCAWQIKELYGDTELQKKLNIDSSRAVFEFVFKNQFVKKFIYFSSIAAYGAFPENLIDKLLNERDALSENEALYGLQKKMAEEMLYTMYEANDKAKQVFVLRLASVTGPRGRGLESKKIGLLNILKNVLPFIPVASENWCRQYVHEDDVTDVVGMFVFNNFKKRSTYEVYNLSPNDLVFAKDMASIFHKNILKVPPVFVRLAFYLIWHLSRGKIPTSQASWRSFIYPIPVDGSLLTKKYGFQYTYTSREALLSEVGRYGDGVEITGDVTDDINVPL